MVEADGIGTEDRGQGIGGVRELDEGKHRVDVGIILLFPMEFFIDGKPARSGLSYPGKGTLKQGLRTQARGYSYKYSDFYRDLGLIVDKK